MIIKAESEAVIEVTLKAVISGIEPEAGFALDLIDRGEDGGGSIGEIENTSRSELNVRRDFAASVPVRITAHVSRLGDIEANSNEWIAGPQLPLPIEGVAIAAAGKGTDVDIEVQVLTSRSSGQWSEWIGEGRFAGTRQRAEPIVGLRLRLVGGQADGYVIAAEALFLGSAATKKIGRNIEFSSSDPMVGLKLDVIRNPVNAEERAEPRSKQIRVFRAES